MVEIENVTTLRLLMPLFHPGDLKSICVIDRQPDGAWRYHSLLRVGDGASMIVGQDDGKSYANCAIAYYRHIAGIATDHEPPAMR